MSIWAPISFMVIMGGYLVVGYIIEKRTTKRIRTKAEQDFVDWYELTVDYGYSEDITYNQHKLYEKIVKRTVRRP